MDMTRVREDPAAHDLTPPYQFLTYRENIVCLVDLHNAHPDAIRTAMAATATALERRITKTLLLVDLMGATWDMPLFADVHRAMYACDRNIARMALILSPCDIQLRYVDHARSLFQLPFVFFMERVQALEWLTRPPSDNTLTRRNP